ncbi:Secretory lipase [Fusarium globosum]|uniref:Secretory lipase n=1 Tax=Fusarium globosum TaxID=78864 RepID=A0A8H5Y468_9HYPO|nr:Secretory lipase [Fusarium globosum]
MHLYSLFTSLALSSFVLRGADPSKAPTSLYCKGECQKNFTIGWEIDAGNWVAANLSHDPFWHLPQNVSTAKPGDILRWQDIDATTAGANWTIPAGASLSRFQYASEDVDGKIVAASAFLLIPYAPPNGAKRLRTLHHTLLCNLDTRSLHRTMLGLGSTTPKGFQYVAGWTHAADVAFSVIAAKKRIGTLLSDEWVTVGQSEGGMAAWRVNERLALPGQDALKKAGNFLGSVAIAPANRPTDLIDYLNSMPVSADGSANGLTAYLLPNIANLYPELHVEDYLTKTAIGRLTLIRQSCTYGGYYAVGNMANEEFYKNSSWTKHPAVAAWRKTYMGEGHWKLAAPLMIVQGVDDGVVPIKFTVEDYRKTCKEEPGSPVRLLTYAGQNHDSVTNSAQADYMSWVNDLFNRKKMKKGCSREDIRPLTDRFQPVAIQYIANM